MWCGRFRLWMRLDGLVLLFRWVLARTWWLFGLVRGALLLLGLGLMW